MLIIALCCAGVILLTLGTIAWLEGRNQPKPQPTFVLCPGISKEQNPELYNLVVQDMVHRFALKNEPWIDCDTHHLFADNQEIIEKSIYLMRPADDNYMRVKLEALNKYYSLI